VKKLALASLALAALAQLCVTCSSSKRSVIVL
jgi:hypothetical protein